MRWRPADVTLELWSSRVAVALNVLTNEVADQRAALAALEGGRRPGADEFVAVEETCDA